MEKAVQLKRLSPNLMVDDVNKTVAYYEDYLGFEVEMTMPEEGESFWAIVKRGSASIMFQQHDFMLDEYPYFKEGPAGRSFLMYVEVIGIQKLYESLKSNVKVSLVKDIYDTHYDMREFAIKDCNGYTLTFGEIIQKRIKPASSTNNQ